MDRETVERYRTRLLGLKTLLRDEVTRLAFTPDCEMTQQMWAKKKQRLQKIEDALERIENGSYGRCRHCGRRIVKPRLTAVPFTDSCTACAARNLSRPVCRGKPRLSEPGERAEWQACAGFERPSARSFVWNGNPQGPFAETRGVQALGTLIEGKKPAKSRHAAFLGFRFREWHGTKCDHGG